jgi:transposase
VATNNNHNLAYYSSFIPNRDISLVNLDKIYGINPPFYIIDFRFDEDSFESHFTISYERKLTFNSPCCDAPNSKVHSYNPRIIRSLDIGNTKAFFHIYLPKIKCSKCGAIHVLQLPFISNRSNLSVQFQQKTLAYCEVMSFSAASKLLGESGQRLAAVVNAHVEKARENLDFSDV